MKQMFAIVVSALTFCVVAPSAFAAGPNCSAIESIGERIACYDKAFPPKVKKSAATENNTARAAYKDPYLAEDARTAAKLKTICRGC